jgi:hypothetical protein
MKIYEAWEELADWLSEMFPDDLLSPKEVLDKIDELEAKYE